MHVIRMHFFALRNTMQIDHVKLLLNAHAKYSDLTGQMQRLI